MRWVLALVVSVGCYAPSAQPGAKCADNGICPEGLVCSPASGTCELRATPHDASPGDDGMVIDGRVVDASPDAPPPMATLVQNGTNSLNTAAMLQITLPAAPSSGNVLVLVGGTPAGLLTSVTGGGVAWTKAAESAANTNIEVWYGVTDGSSAVITLSRTNNISPMWGLVTEWSGLRTTMTLDQADAEQALAGDATAGPITTTHAYDLLVFGATAYSPVTFGTPMPGTWTALPGITMPLGVTQGAWYRTETAAGTFTPQVTKTNGQWDAAVVALRIAP